MTKYKLMYFDIKALAEPIRFLFHYGGVEFEDYRYDKEEWFNKLKPKAPFGQGPLLEIDGEVMWQSVAIQRYVAELVGLAGKNNLEKAEVDVMAESVWDLRCLLYSYYFDKPENKPAREENVFKVQLPYIMGRLNAFVGENGGYFVGGKVTWPDLQYTAYYEYLNVMAGRDIEVGGLYPNLKALRQKVSEIPQIKAWIARRPQTEW